MTSGDCAGELLEKSGLPGEVFVWHDILYDGPRFGLHHRRQQSGFWCGFNRFAICHLRNSCCWNLGVVALVQGGCLRFQFAGDGNCINFFTVVREAMTLEELRMYFSGFEWPWYMPSIDEYDCLAGSSGLRDVRVWGENVDRYFPDAEAMIRWIDQPSLVPFLALVADPAKDSFRDYVVRRMIDKTKQEDGRCFETFRRINVSGTK